MKKTYKIEEVITLMRANPKKKFTYYYRDLRGAYITLEGERIVWRGGEQEGQLFVLGDMHTEWCEYNPKIPILFSELCRIVKSNPTVLKVYVEHPNYKTGEPRLFEEYIGELTDRYWSSELAELFLNGRWYVEETE